MSIPKCIHQIWLSNEDIPMHIVRNIQSWKKHNSTWEYRLWDKDACDKLMNKYIDVKSVYERSSEIVQSDVARIAILIECGGIYADLNTFCLMSFDDVVDNELTIRNTSNSFIMAPVKAKYLVEFIKSLEGKTNTYQPLSYAGAIALSLFDITNGTLVRNENSFCEKHGRILDGVTRSVHQSETYW